MRSSTHTFRTIPGGGWVSEWAMSKASIAEMAGRSCGQNVIDACHVGNIGTSWMIPALKEAIKLKKEAFPRLGSGCVQPGSRAADPN